MPESGERVTCQEVTEMVTDYLEGALPVDEAALFEQHLNFCDGCDWYVDQMKLAIAMSGRVEETVVPPHLRDRLLAAFRDRDRS